MIVVIGLGNLGLAFASRLHQSVGHTVGVDPDGSARAAFEADGGATASSLADLDWSDVDTVFVVVRTVAQALTVVDEIGTRRAGYADATATRVFVVTTMDPESAGQLTSRPGIRVMESPISGGSDGTLAGSLTVLLGGPVEADDVTFLESTVAGTVVRFTELGHATLAKLINNAVMAANALIVANALEVARIQGLDLASFYSVLKVSSGGSRAAQKFVNLDAPLLEKDARLLLQASSRSQWPSLWSQLLGHAETLSAHLDGARQSLAPHE
ncbi:NAD(P)-binding domain-containing protein [Nocardioides pyridinolyticus]